MWKFPASTMVHSLHRKNTTKYSKTKTLDSKNTYNWMVSPFSTWFYYPFTIPFPTLFLFRHVVSPRGNGPTLDGRPWRRPRLAACSARSPGRPPGPERLQFVAVEVRQSSEMLIVNSLYINQCVDVHLVGCYPRILLGYALFIQVFF